MSPLSRKIGPRRGYLTPLTAARTGKKQRRPGSSHGAWAHAPLGARRQRCRWALGKIETVGCRSCAAKRAKLTPMQGPEGDRTNHRRASEGTKAGLSVQTHGDWTRCIACRRRRISRRTQSHDLSRLCPSTSVRNTASNAPGRRRLLKHCCSR